MAVPALRGRVIAGCAPALACGAGSSGRFPVWLMLAPANKIVRRAVPVTFKVMRPRFANWAEQTELSLILSPNTPAGGAPFIKSRDFLLRSRIELCRVCSLYSSGTHDLPDARGFSATAGLRFS